MPGNTADTDSFIAMPISLSTDTGSPKASLMPWRNGVMYSELSDGIMHASIVIPVNPSFAMNTISLPDSPVPSRWRMYSFSPISSMCLLCMQ